MASQGIIWRSPFTAASALQMLPGGSYCKPYGCSHDGSVVVGEAQDAAGNTWAVRWNGTEITQLPPLTGQTASSHAYACSQDGFTIFGIVNGAGVVVWDGAGAHLLALPAGFDGISQGGAQSFGRGAPISDSGAVVCGYGHNTAAGHMRGLEWNSLAVTALPVSTAPSMPTTLDGYTASVAPDGTIVLGYMAPSGWYACYWKAGVCYLLYDPSLPFRPSGVSYQTLGMTSDDGAIWGITSWGQSTPTIPPLVYWDGLATLTDATNGFYGTSHALAKLPGFTDTTKPGIAVNGLAVASPHTAPIAVGFGYGPDGNAYATKWTGTAIAQLTTTPGLLASACSGDGSIVAGDNNGNNPAWWNASNVQAALPLLATSFSGSGSVMNVSRDGSTILGITLTQDSGGGGGGGPSTPPPYLSMDDVTVTTIPHVGDCRLALRWSDDRGHSWGNPVMQNMGDKGVYRRSMQYQRLGMARDRVFELSWSCAAPTALLGAFVEADTRATS